MFWRNFWREYFLRLNILRGSWAEVVLHSEQASILLLQLGTELGS